MPTEAQQRHPPVDPSPLFTHTPSVGLNTCRRAVPQARYQL